MDAYSKLIDEVSGTAGDLDKLLSVYVKHENNLIQLVDGDDFHKQEEENKCVDMLRIAICDRVLKEHGYRLNDSETYQYWEKV